MRIGCFRKRHCSPQKLPGALFGRCPTFVAADSSDPVPWLLFLLMFAKQFEQTLAHDHSRPVRRHVHLDLSAHVDDCIGSVDPEILWVFGGFRMVMSVSAQLSQAVDYSFYWQIKRPRPNWAFDKFGILPELHCLTYCEPRHSTSVVQIRKRN